VIRKYSIFGFRKNRNNPQQLGWIAGRSKERRAEATIELGFLLPLFAIFIMFFIAMGRAGDTAIAVSAESRSNAFASRDGKSTSQPLVWPPQLLQDELEVGSAQQLVVTQSIMGNWGPLGSSLYILDSPWDHRTVELNDTLNTEKYAAVLSSIPGAQMNNLVASFNELAQSISNPMGVLKRSLGSQLSDINSQVTGAISEIDNGRKKALDGARERIAELDQQIAKRQSDVDSLSGTFELLASTNSSNLAPDEAKAISRTLIENQRQIFSLSMSNEEILAGLKQNRIDELKSENQKLIFLFGDQWETAAKHWQRAEMALVELIHLNEERRGWEQMTR